MANESESKLEEITKRLDAIIYLLMKQNPDFGTAQQMIKELNDIGLKDTEIAKIMGKSRGYISSALVKIRKTK